MKQQVVVIHGGDSFNTRKNYLRSLRCRPVNLANFFPRTDWKTGLQKELGTRFQVLHPRMPNSTNASYQEWKIWFGRMFPFLHHGVILIGHSLGAMFLAKYLAENNMPKKIAAVIFVAAPHNHSGEVGSFRVPRSLKRIARQCQHLYLFHSPNDPVVPFSELSVYTKALPIAKPIVLRKRGHINQQKFPELVRLIKTLGDQ